MAAPLAVIPAVLAGIKAARDLIEYVRQLKRIARQSGEMTAEQDEAYDAELADLLAGPAWTPSDEAPPTLSEDGGS